MKHSDRTINRHNGGSSIKVYWKKQALTIMTLFMLAGLSGCSGGETLETNSTTEAESGSMTSMETDIDTEESTESSLEKMEAYKRECQEFDYKEYFRNEQQHKGEKIKLEMRVAQVHDGSFRGYDALGNEYYIIDKREEDAPFRVMEEDVLRIYGEYSGVGKVTRAIGDYESEVFAITARYADLIGEDGVVTEIETFPLTETIAQETSSNFYSDSILLWKSYYETLTDADCKGLSKSELRIARNEIYAAYGRIFTSQDLIDYFSSKSWYQGTIPAEQFDDSVLTEIQKYNIRLIQSYEDGAEGGEDYQSRGLAVYDAEAIPQLDGEYTYVDDNDDSRYVTLSIDGYEASLLFYSAFGMSEEMTGFYGVNDIEYWNDSSSVILRFNDYGRQMVYVSGDGSEFTYTFSH